MASRRQQVPGLIPSPASWTLYGFLLGVGVVLVSLGLWDLMLWVVFDFCASR